MTTDHSADIASAFALAQRAEELIGKNKLGAWDSINSLALTSIAKSFAVIAEASMQRPTGQ